MLFFDLFIVPGLIKKPKQLFSITINVNNVNVKKKEVHVHDPSLTYFLVFKFSDKLTQTKYYSVMPSLGNNYFLFTCSIQYPMAISSFLLNPKV